MKIVIMTGITATAVYFMAMMISYAKTGKPDPEDRFRLIWWRE